ncbi:MAG TPA: SDR family oxidoreductase [Sphingobium sp.]|uniref:SDR family NAD(P)-dependent oxidoreductase n=1 Tax=Sphingobium sp. TaxID=1912891 RepID=UPI002ED18B08
MTLAIDLRDKVILVCGCARGGIGGATARRAAEAGATIIALDHTQSLVDETVADIKAAGGEAYGIVCDLTDPSQTDPLIAAITAKHGRLDGIANVAGGTREGEWKPLDETSTESFRQTLNLNLEYVFRLCRDAAREWISRDERGSLVNVGSVSSLTSAPWHGPYGAAKSGISALTRTMANEWWEFGIRANTVNPGGVASERVMKRVVPDNVDQAAGGVEFTTVDEMAYGIIFLLSDLANGISGQTLTIDRALSTKFCAGARKSRKALLQGS